MPLVSIIIPAFHAARFIARALESVRTQTHAEWELIVIEDGSCDGSEAIVREFAARVGQPVHYENNGVNLGVSASRNRAMSLAKGEFLAFLDADDWWTPGHLASGLQTLARGADICCSGFYLYDEPSQKVTGTRIPEPALFENPLVSLFRGNFIQTSSLVLMRRDATRHCGSFDGDLKVGEDCDYWMSLLVCGYKLACTGEATCYYSKHEASAMSKSLMVAEHAVKFHRKHLQNASLPGCLRQSCYAKSLWILGRLIQRQHPLVARSLFLEAWQLRPLDWRYGAYTLRAWVLALFQRG